MAGWDVKKPADSDTLRDFLTLHRADKATLQTQSQADPDVLDGIGTATGRHKYVNIKDASPTVRCIGTDGNGAEHLDNSHAAESVHCAVAFTDSHSDAHADVAAVNTHSDVAPGGVVFVGIPTTL